MDRINNDNELPDDLKRIMSNFVKLKESYLKEQNLRQEYIRVVNNLKEENIVVRDIEKAERNKLNIAQQLVEQQQDNISSLLSVKSENLRLTSLVKELNNTLLDQKNKLAEEKKKWDSDRVQLEAKHTLETKEIELKYREKALETHKESESSVGCYKLQISELKRKLDDKENELSAKIFKYEEKLRETEEKQNSREMETQKVIDQATHDIYLHKKRSLELEQEYNKLLKQIQEQTSADSLRKTYENPIPGLGSSTYLSPVAQNRPQIVPLKTIVKKMSAYSLNALNTRRTFVSSPDDFKNSKCNSVSENKNDKLPSSLPVIQVSSSTTNTLESITLSSEICHNNSPTPEKKIGIVKKRKLFRSVDQDLV